ncbi:tail collar fiber protein [Vibrio phage D479]
MKGTTIFSHVIDDASTVTVDLEQTAFNGLTADNTLQSCLELIDVHATTGIPPWPIADESTAGVSRHATNAEALDTTNDSQSITPMTLDYWFSQLGIASEVAHGTVQLITEDSIDNGNPTDSTEEATNHAFTLKTLNYALNTKFYSNETTAGVVRYATQAQAETVGTLSKTVAMTPERTKQMIDVWGNSSASSASETAKGLIQLANATTVNDTSSSSQLLAISPYRFNSRTATTSRKAGFYLPTASVANARTSNEHAVTVGTLDLFAATTSRVGAIKLIDNLTTNDATAGLTANMGKWLNENKIGEAGGTVNGRLYINDVNSIGNVPVMRSGRVQSTAMLNMYPVGAVYMSLSSTSPSTLFGGSWTRMAQGRVLVGQGTLQGRTFNVRQTGGEYEVVLTEATMPSHKHAGWGEHHWYNGKGLGFGVATQYGRGNIGSRKTDSDNYLYYSEPKGGSGAHNNIQPYLVVYMWERTA